jgi:hypothetical protein
MVKFISIKVEITWEVTPGSRGAALQSAVTSNGSGKNNSPSMHDDIGNFDQEGI